MLYGLVFITRYLDIFDKHSWNFSDGGFYMLYNLIFKLFYITSSLYLVFIMMKVFPRTRERERAWKLGIYSVIGSLVLSPISIYLLEIAFRKEPREFSNWFLEVGLFLIAAISHAFADRTC